MQMKTPLYQALLERRAQQRQTSPSPDALGSGFQAPFALTLGGTLGLETGASHVATCIRLILGTRPGERRMRPEFGCSLHDFFFAPNTPQTRYRIQRAVEQALEAFESRIEDLEVRVTPDPRALERIHIQVSYRLPGALAPTVQRFGLALKP